MVRYYNQLVYLLQDIGRDTYRWLFALDDQQWLLLAIATTAIGLGFLRGFSSRLGR